MESTEGPAGERPADAAGRASAPGPQPVESRLATISRHPIVSSAVAAVLAGTVLAVVTPLLGGEDSDTGAQSDTSTIAVGEASSEPGGTATTSAPGSTSAPRSTSTDASTTSGPTTTASPMMALLVAAEYNLDHYSDGWQVALAEPFPASEPAEWPGTDDVLGWALERGAVPTYTALRVVIEGAADSVVTIVGATARIVDESTPEPPGYLTSESAGAQGGIRLYFDLDESTPEAYALSDDDFGGIPQSGKRFFADQVVTVAPGEVVVFLIEAGTVECDCRWVIDLDTVVGGISDTVTIDLAGEPIRTVAFVQEVPHYGVAWWDPEVEFVEYAEDWSSQPLP